MFSTVPSGRNFLSAVFQPLRSWLISGRRFATPFALTLAGLFFAHSALAQTTNILSDAEIEGQALAQKILTQFPVENYTKTGVLKIKDANGVRSDVPVECQTFVTATNWQTVYKAGSTNKIESLWVIHTADQPNLYAHDTYNIVGGVPLAGHLMAGPKIFSDAEMATAFAGSDFALADLGLEFFHWPQQKVLKKEFYRQCSCTVLESTNPHPAANGYSRVMAWIDQDSLGIVEAYAYDVNGKKLKDFYPKNVKKINGQWQVLTLVMENVQTDSKSRLEFDAGK